MNFFNKQRGGEGHAGNGSAGGGSKELQRQVTTLLARVESATLQEDKLTALDELKDLYTSLPTPPTNVDSHILHSLIQCVQQFNDDVEATKLAVGILYQLIVIPYQKQQQDPSTSSSTPINSPLIAQFVSQPTNITTLLDVTAHKDAYIRYNTIQLLTILLMERTQSVQTTILSHAMGVNLLLDLLEDRREMIRNEILLLLEVLTRDNTAIQKIVAFGNGFDALFRIIAQEDSIQIVEDCLRLVNVLLADNPSNHMMFSEAQCTQALPPLLHVPPTADFTRSPTCDAAADPTVAQHIAQATIIRLAIDILQHITTSIEKSVEDNNSKNTGIQQALAPVQQSLVDLSHNKLLPADLQHTCLSILSMSIYHHSSNQQRLQMMNVTVRNKQQPAINYLLELAMNSNDVVQASLAEYVLKSYLDGNKQAQFQLASTFAPQESQQQQSVQPFGRLLLAAYERQYQTTAQNPEQPMIVALRLLAYLLRNNNDTQLMLVSIPIALPSSANEAPPRLLDVFLYLYTTLVASTPEEHIVLSLLLVVCEWLHTGSQSNTNNTASDFANEFFGRDDCIQLLLLHIGNTQGGIHTRALASYAIALALHLSSDVAQQALQTVTQKIGLDTFKSVLAELKATPEFELSSQYKTSNILHNNPVEVVKAAERANVQYSLEYTLLYDNNFVKRYTRIVDGLGDRLLTLLTNSASATTQLQSPAPLSSDLINNTAAGSSEESRRLRAENEQLRHELETARRQLHDAQQHAEQLQHQQAHAHTTPTALNGFDASSLQQQLQTEQKSTKQLNKQLQSKDLKITQLQDQLSELDIKLRAAQETLTHLQMDSMKQRKEHELQHQQLQQQFDDLNAEHEDLLILLGSYETDGGDEQDVAEEEEEKKQYSQPSASQHQQQSVPAKSPYSNGIDYTPAEQPQPSASANGYAENHKHNDTHLHDHTHHSVEHKHAHDHAHDAHQHGHHHHDANGYNHQQQPYNHASQPSYLQQQQQQSSQHKQHYQPQLQQSPPYNYTSSEQLPTNYFSSNYQQQYGIDERDTHDHPLDRYDLQ